MLNFNKVKEDFEQQVIDILKYEIYYYDDNDIIFHNLVDRFRKYMEMNWAGCDIDWGITKASLSNFIEIKIQINEDPPFGFEFCYDLEMLKKQKTII